VGEGFEARSEDELLSAMGVVLISRLEGSFQFKDQCVNFRLIAFDGKFRGDLSPWTAGRLNWVLHGSLVGGDTGVAV
jgi:hypothetical protein